MPRQSDCTLQPHNAAARFPRSLTLARNAPRIPAKNRPRKRQASKGDDNFGTLSSLPGTPTLLPQQPGIPNAVPGFFSLFQLFSIGNLFYRKINPIFASLLIRNNKNKMRKLLITAFALLAFAAGSQARTNDKNTKNMKTIALAKADFLKKVADYEKNPQEWKYLGDKPALIDFYASWCGPCKALAPVLEELAAEYGDRIYIYKVNTEEEQELAAAFGIRSIPTLLFVPMNGKPQMAQGAMPKASLKEAIDKVMLGK